MRKNPILSKIKQIKYKKKDFVLCHYPFESWKNKHHGAIHLFGHVHGKLPFKEKRLDVGLDSAYKLLGEYRPFNWEEIKKILL